MSVWSAAYNQHPALSTLEGELVAVRITVNPRLLEDLLEALAEAAFPINPEIFHSDPLVVEFPAYRGRLSEVRSLLKRHGFDPRAMAVRDMLDEIRAM